MAPASMPLSSLPLYVADKKAVFTCPHCGITHIGFYLRECRNRLCPRFGTEVVQHFEPPFPCGSIPDATAEKPF